VIDSDAKLPLSFVRPPREARESTKPRDIPPLLLAELTTRAKYGEFGQRPLFVTDYIDTGSYCRWIIQTFRQLQCTPSIASLCARSTDAPSEMKKAGAEQVFIQGHPEGVLSIVYQQSWLNGVTIKASGQHEPFSWKRVMSYRSAGGHDSTPPGVRHHLVSYSREVLQEMVECYKAARVDE
jgi:hypothetical protein